jgi:GGDEF domain-containing protein
VDFLTRENDSEGHEAGDALIIDVADGLMEAFGSEYVFRLGFWEV